MKKLSANILSIAMRLVFTLSLWVLLIQQAHAQFSGIPLHKGHAGGDTTVMFSNEFTVHGRSYTPVNMVQIHWDGTHHTFQMKGEATSTVDSHNFHFNMGTTGSYFMLSADSSITTFTPNVIDTFLLEGQKFMGIADKTFYNYNTSNDQESIYGNVRIYLDGEHFAARLGSSEDPGAKIVDNEVSKVWLHIEDLLRIKGLNTHDLSKTDIILRHQQGDPANTYYGFGFWAIYLLEVEQLASMGTASNPGLVVSDSKIDSVKMLGGGGGFLFGGIPVLDAFEIEYNHAFGKYSINGLINIGIPMGGFAKALGAKYAPSFEVHAGDQNNPGFLLNPSNGKFEVADVVLSLKRVNGREKVSAGGFEINELSLGIKNNWPDSIYGLGTFPPGFALEISLGFHINKTALLPDERFYINSIGVTWTASSTAQAIPVGTTGFNIVRLGGEIDNLLDYHNLSLTGDIGMVYGDPVTIDIGVFGISGLTGTKTISMVYVEGIVTLSTHGLSFTAIGDLGSLFSAGHWQGVIGELEGGISISWGGTVKMDADIKAYAPPFDVIDAGASLSFHQSGDIDANGHASLQVPHFIPVIGGKSIGSANFALRYKKSSLDQSYAAAWAKFNLIFDHVTAGIKANFKSGKITKVGAAAARALSHHNISDDQQHPIGPDGQPVLQWYACGLTHHFTLPSGRPPAYLQNQIVINDSRFEHPFVQHLFYSPAVATITSPSSQTDLKILTPDDVHDIYFNQGQTTPQDNTMAIDFSMDFVEGGSDTIKWITVNQAAEAYASIDWVHQPDLLLTPGEYVLTVSGYCHELQQPLQTSDMHYNVSPIYPRPTISMTGDGAGTFTIDYSAYLTDSTIVSLYWNYDQGDGGNLIAHLPYHEGTLIGDSLYRWVVEDWDPGITSATTLYFYAVIDDFTNHPVQSDYSSVFYTINLHVTVNGGDSLTTVVLSPADTTLSDVFGINNGNAIFYFCNMPVGEYTFHVYNGDSLKALDINMDINIIDGIVLERFYHSPDWVTLRMNVETWDYGIGDVLFFLGYSPSLLYGQVTDTSGMMLRDAKVVLLNEQTEIVAQADVNDAGYLFNNASPGLYRLGVQLPLSNDFHWPSPENLKYIVTEGIVGVTYIQDSVEITSESKAINYRVLQGAQGPVFNTVDFSNNPVANVVVTIYRQDGTGPNLQAVSDSNGLAFFEGHEVDQFVNYKFYAAWPDGYHALTPQGQTFQWLGTGDIQQVIGQED